ncbi:hypothetical protein TNIN_219821 [Trichonephila inaurata madagascariensis]|uniref:Uncharacterized protein n=1 Tax=Trichonephila inaurata madagascariensis TaxID=2747483 RepID=A0A8X6XV66_9ARAC|nr:hypothetical protein TNIN_219821 [Trichonephila inaurata madagascariensis]
MFRYSFGRITWRNANLSFDVFEEKPRLIAVTRFFENSGCSFRCSNSVKIRTRFELLSESSWGTHPAIFHTFPSILRRRKTVELIDIEVFSQHSCCQALVLSHGCQKA